MSRALSAIKPEVQALAPYTLRHHAYRYKMNQNENPFGFPEELKEEVWRRVRERDWALYPDFFLREVTERMAAHAGVPADWVLVGNGSNELIQVTLMVTLARGESAVIPVPTFTIYRLMGVVMGAAVREPHLEAGDFALPTAEIVRLANEAQARLIILNTPNNPTGNTYAEADIRRIMEETPSLVVVDEAYRDFSDQNLRPLLDEYENLVILRTFSKAMALAGLRIGYLIARPELVKEIAKAKLPYGLNILSEAAAIVALDHIGLLRERVETIRHLRDQLYQDLRAIDGIHPYPSQANFILCRFARPAEEVFAGLLEREGVLVRDVSRYPMLEGHLRISVGDEQANEALLRGLRAICQGK